MSGPIAMDASSTHRNGESDSYGPWNPGITSYMTADLWRMCTIFRPENVFTTYEQAVEFGALTGLPLTRFVVWRPERMVLHDVLVRVIADYEVADPEGADVASLGINFRRMTRAILERHVAPQMGRLVSDYTVARNAIQKIVAGELAVAFRRTPEKVRDPVTSRPWSLRFWCPSVTKHPVQEDPVFQEDRLIELWGDRAHGNAQAAATYDALISLISAIRAWNGRIWGSPEFVEPLVTGLACNVVGAQLVAERVGPVVAKAAAAEGFRPLPPQEHPIGISTKGASAAGKSTMRPLLRLLAAQIGASWRDFALVSPDIFRRDLLDIDSLGPHYKYFGTFTSHELEMVDFKLDQYLAHKARLGIMPHVLVDRFRFDSFAPESDDQKRLFTRLGKRKLSYYIYMITPPEKTVERAWIRGLQIGRYKPVDHLLAHNVEAYLGMQSFFFGRILHPCSRNQHHEFVDNGVPMGEIPLTIAFGTQDEFNVLDVMRMVDIDRYCKINIDARCSDELYPEARSLAVENNVKFLRKCIASLPAVNFAHRETGCIYARFERGRLSWHDRSALGAIEDPEVLAVLHALESELFAPINRGTEGPRYLNRSQSVTLGRWGRHCA